MSKNKKYSSGNEEQRIRELLRYKILDTPDEQEFDNLTKVAANLCDVKYSQINFLDQDRQWSKSCHGWDMKEIPREESICKYTLQQEKYLVINHLGEDPRFKDYHYVKDKKVQCYAGVVLKSSHGYNIGTLCVFSEKPKQFTDQQIESLQILGDSVQAQLELRLKREELVSEHKKLQKTAKFLQNATDLWLIVNPASLYVEEVSKKAEKLLGYRPGEIINTPITDFIVRQEFDAGLKDWTKNKIDEPFVTETIFKTKKDKRLWFRLTLTKEQDKFYVTGRNITHQKTAEQDLLKQTRLTENIIQYLPGIFFLVDKKGRIKKWNNNLENKEKRTPGEVKNQSYKNFIAPEDHKKIGRSLREIFDKGFSRTEVNFVAKNGDTTPVLLIGFRFHDDQETYATGIGINISEEKKALQELEQKEQKLKEAQRIGKMGSWTWHIPTNEIYWSDEVFELYGLDKETFHPTLENFGKMLSDSEQKKVEQIIQQIMEGKDWKEVELQVQKPDGTLVYIHEQGEVFYDEAGNPVEVSGTMQDVTARRENEEKLKAALKEKEVLLAEIHHRVKNNLAIINGLLQLEVFNSKNESIQSILSESQMRIHSMALIHESLYSSGDFANISFGNYIKELSQVLLDTFEKKSQHIKIRLNTEDVCLNINQAIPCALLVNELVTNSLKHAFPASQKGTITINLHETDHTVYLEISDDGVGFEAEPAPKEFDTLGLTLVESLITQINGDIKVNNKNGTAFKISFKKKHTGGSSANYFHNTNN